MKRHRLWFAALLMGLGACSKSTGSGEDAGAVDMSSPLSGDLAGIPPGADLATTADLEAGLTLVY